jgi:autotransporter-associated beta strand protein
LANNVTIGGNVQFGDSTGTGNLTLSGTVNLGASTRTLTISNVKTRIDGVISGSGGLTKEGTGTLRLTAANTYTGTTTLSGGTLRIDNAGALGSGNFVQTSGGTLLEVAATGTITNTMSIYNVSFTESVTLTGAKTLNNATITVETGDTVTEQGVLSGDGGLTKEGGGEYILNGSANNTYSGATEVNAGSLVLSNSSGNAIHSSSGITVNSGGTLVLADSDQIGDGIGLTLNGGTFLVGASALTEKLGTLTLTANSTLDFGVFETPGERILTFDNSFGIEWTGTLTITNWQGVAQTSSELTRLVFGVDGLDNDQLGQIVFASQGITGGELIGGGELVPVPEPRVYAAAVALLAVVGWRERKRLLGLLSRGKKPKV